MRRRLLLAAALLLPGGAASPAPAPEPAAAARAEALAAAARAARFEREAVAARGEAARLRARSEAMIAGIERTEAEITVAEARLRALARRHAAARARLAAREQPAAELLAALQRLGRQRPALALLRPGAADETMRTRALLAAALPPLLARGKALRAELAAERRLGAQGAAAVAVLAERRRALSDARRALVRLEAEALRRSAALAGTALAATDRYLGHAERARELSAEDGGGIGAARRAALAALPPPPARPGSLVAGTDDRPRYRLPVAGRLIEGSGALSTAGIHARGMTFAAAAGAPVTAPRAGTIVYAGRFRGYGEIVVVDHGGGWTSTLTGLAALRVQRGERVAAGAPLGRAGARVGAELRHGGRPRPIAPLLGIGPAR